MTQSNEITLYYQMIQNCGYYPLLDVRIFTFFLMCRDRKYIGPTLY